MTHINMTSINMGEYLQMTAVERIGSQIAASLADRRDEEIRKAITARTGITDFSPLSLRLLLARLGRFSVKHANTKEHLYELWTLDDTPLIEFYPVEIDQEDALFKASIKFKIH